MTGDIHSPRYPLHYPTNAHAEYNLVNDMMGKNGRVKLVFDDYSINAQTILVRDFRNYQGRSFMILTELARRLQKCIDPATKLVCNGTQESTKSTIECH